MKGNPIFENTSGDAFDIFMPFVREDSYEEGALIFSEGSDADSFFLIKYGEVEIRKIIDEETGSYKLISVLTKGDFFGEMAVFQGQPRSAAAYAKTSVTLFSVSKESLADLFKDKHDPAFRAMGFLASVLMERLGNTTKELTAVYETGRLIASARSVDDLADVVMQAVLKAVDSAEGGLFCVWNKYNDDFEVAFRSGADVELGDFFQSDDPLAIWFAENREPFLSFDMNSDGRLEAAKESPYYARSIVAAPFFHEDRLTGFMLLLNRTKPGAFAYSQMVLLSAISGYVSVSLENLKFVQEEIDRYRFNQMKHRIQL